MGDHELQLFQSIGLSEAKAKETAKNVTLSKTLVWIISEVEPDHVMTVIDVIDARLTHCVMEISVSKLGTCYITLLPDSRVLRRTSSY